MEDIIAVNDNVNVGYDPSIKIFFKWYSGEIILDDIFRSWDYIIDNNLIPSGVKGFVLDYTNVDLKIDASGAGDITDFYNNHPHIFEGKKIALIMNTPGQVIFPLLVASSNPQYYPKPFMTEEAAIRWILE